MRTYALLPPDLLVRLRMVAPRAVIPSRSTVSEVLSALQHGSEGAFLIVDPNEFHPDAFGALIRAAARSGAHVFLYGRLSAAYARRVVAADEIMLVDLAIVGESGDRVLAQCLSEGADRISIPAQVFRGVADRVGRLTTPIRTSIVGLFAGEPLPTHAATIYLRLSIDPGTALDHLHAAGLASMRELLGGARLCRAWPSLRDRSSTLDAIADRFGFGGVRTLSDTCVRFTGMSPRKAGEQLTVEDVVVRVIAKLYADDQAGGS